MDSSTNVSIRVRWIHSTNLAIRVRSTDLTNPKIGRIFTAYLSLANALRLIHQSCHSCPMDRFDESFHSCPMDGSNESNYLCSMDRTRPVLISFPHYCGTKFTNRTDRVDSTILDNPHLGRKGTKSPLTLVELGFVLKETFFTCAKRVQRRVNDDVRT